MDDKLLWDIRSLLRACGGVEPFRSKCLELGLEVFSNSAVRQWQTRGNAPADGLAALITVAHRRNPDLDPLSFIRRSPGGAA